eukprot:340516-Rhodomonas_salina.1
MGSEKLIALVYPTLHYCFGVARLHQPLGDSDPLVQDTPGRILGITIHAVVQENPNTGPCWELAIFAPAVREGESSHARGGRTQRGEGEREGGRERGKEREGERKG